MDEVSFGRGENIIEQGKNCTTFYVVASGQSELVKRVNGKVQHSTCRAGDYFGEEALKGPGSRYSSTCVALQTSSCWKLEPVAMQKIVMPLINS